MWQAPYAAALAPLYHTVLHLACKQPGATNADMVVSNAWLSFSTGQGPANAKTWDNKPLYYYKAGELPTDAKILVWEWLASSNLNGQCTAWAKLFEQTLWAHGIKPPAGTNEFMEDPNSTRTVTFFATNFSPDEVIFLVNNWSFAAAGTNAMPYAWNLEANYVNGRANMNPPESLSGTVTNMPGVAGQNSTNPALKIFSSHTLLRYTDAATNSRLYDPSYGRTYTNEAHFWAEAVAGFGTIANSTSNRITFRVRRNE